MKSIAESRWSTRLLYCQGISLCPSISGTCSRIRTALSLSCSRSACWAREEVEQETRCRARNRRIRLYILVPQLIPAAQGVRVNNPLKVPFNIFINILIVTSVLLLPWYPCRYCGASSQTFLDAIAEQVPNHALPLLRSRFPNILAAIMEQVPNHALTLLQSQFRIMPCRYYGANSQ